MDEQLIQEYQKIKDRVSKIEEDKIKTSTELDIKKQELDNIVKQLEELGITDLTQIDKIVDEKREKFENTLKTLKEQLDNVSGSQI